jgi:hypothetical protein
MLDLEGEKEGTDPDSGRICPLWVGQGVIITSQVWKQQCSGRGWVHSTTWEEQLCHRTLGQKREVDVQPLHATDGKERGLETLESQL